MKRYSPSFQLVPVEGKSGVYTLWVGISEWEGPNCKAGEQFIKRTITQVPEVELQAMGQEEWLLEIADIIYREISADIRRRIETISSAKPRPYLP